MEGRDVLGVTKVKILAKGRSSGPERKFGEGTIWKLKDNWMRVDRYSSISEEKTDGSRKRSFTAGDSCKWAPDPGDHGRALNLNYSHSFDGDALRVAAAVSDLARPNNHNELVRAHAVHQVSVLLICVRIQYVAAMPYDQFLQRFSFEFESCHEECI